MEEMIYDVIVVGAGAAGMMAAGTAAKNGKRVLLLEKMEKSGRKVRISGKGRCNVTNARPAEEFAEHVRSGAEFFSVAFAEFNNRSAIRFFERMGCRLEVERGERVFPKSGKAWDVANALLEYCVDNGVKIMYDTPVTEVMVVGGRVYGVKYMNKRGFERKAEAERIIITTGGLSYEATGSSGDGLAFAADLGHDIVPVRPSLTPLRSNDPTIRKMEGLMLRNTRATLLIDGEAVRDEMGEVTISDRGLEGAVILRLSRAAVDAVIDGKKVVISLDLKPGLDHEMLHDRIDRDIEEMEPTDIFFDLLRRLVPKLLVIPLCDRVDIFSKQYIEKMTVEDVARLVENLKAFEVEISDYAPFPFA
ncbi:MAG: aminoacetone oxidase family FAD-binding enzyme, partial [Rikenellaceae bacterium]